MMMTVYTMLLVLRAKLYEDIAYAESVVESVGEPAEGYSEHIMKSKELLKSVEKHIAFLESA